MGAPGREPQRWQPSMATVLLVAATLPLVGNLATNTVQVSWRWWPHTIWAVLGVLVAASLAIEARRQRHEHLDPADLLGVAQRLAQRLLADYDAQAYRTGATRPVRLSVEFRLSDAAREFEVEGDVAGIAAAFRALPSRQLLVVGDASAGKSVLALLLGRDLLMGRDLPPPTADGPARLLTPVPVLVPISSWDPHAETVTAFVARYLAAGWVTNRIVAERLVTERRVQEGLPPHLWVMPVLDGLDELPEDRRPAALSALEEYAAAEHPFVLTCRRREYTEIARLAGRVLHRAAVLDVHPVPVERVEQYLATDGPGRWADVVAEVRDRPDGPLAATLDTPLMVAMAREAYRGDNDDPRELIALPSRQAIAARLIDRYVEAAYDPDDPRLIAAPRTRLRHYPRPRALRWLEQLANGLYGAGSRDLDVRELSALTLDEGRGGAGFLVTAGLLAGVVLLVAAVTWPLAGWWAAVRIAVAAGLLLLEVQGDPVWSWSHLDRRTRWAYHGLDAVLGGLAAGLLLAAPLTGLAAGLVTGALLALAATVLAARRPGRPLGTGPMLALTVLVAAGVFAVAGALVAADRVAEVAFAGAVVFGGTAAASLFEPWVWLTYRANHLWLALTGRLPWRLRAFAADAGERGVLRRNGRLLQFRHALIQDRLARRRWAGGAPAPADVGVTYDLAHRRRDGDLDGAVDLLTTVLDAEPRPTDRHDPRWLLELQLVGYLRERGDVEELLRRHAGGLDGAAEAAYDVLVERADVEALRARLEIRDSSAPVPPEITEADLAAPAARPDPDSGRWLFDLLRRGDAVDELRELADGDRPDAALALHRALFDRRDRAALAERADAGDEDARDGLVLLLRDLGDTAELGRLATDNPVAALALAEHLADTAAVSEAVEVLRPHAGGPGGPSVRTEIAELLRRRGDLDAAVDFLAPYANDGDADAGWLLVGLLRDLDDLDGLDGLAAVLPAGQAGQLLRLLRRRGDLDRLRRAVDLGVAGADEQYALALHGLGDEAELRRRADAGDFPALHHLVWLLRDRGRADQAIDVLTRRPAPGGDDEAARAERHNTTLLLAAMLRAQGDALALRRLAEVDRVAQRQLAELLRERGDIGQLRVLADTWLNTPYTEALALAHGDRGDVEAAEGVLRRHVDVLRLEVVRPLLEVYRGAGERAKAVSLLAGWSPPADFAVELADALRDGGDLALAVTLLERLPAQLGDEVGHAVRRAELLQEAGDLDAAIAVLRPYARRGPQYPPSDPDDPFAVRDHLGAHLFRHPGLLLADLQVAAGRTEQAIRTLRFLSDRGEEAATDRLAVLRPPPH